MVAWLAGVLVLAAAPEPLAVLAGAVREFHRIETLEARVEHTRRSGEGRVTRGSYAVRFEKPGKLAVVSLEPAGFVEGFDRGRLVAWNDRLKTGFTGFADALAPAVRERLLLVPAFGLNPLVPLNPIGYDLAARETGGRVTVYFRPRAAGYGSVEMDLLREPYRVTAVRIEKGAARTFVTYSGWREYGGVWFYTQARTVHVGERVQSEETLRYTGLRINAPLPAGWLPRALPASYAQKGPAFFND